MKFSQELIYPDHVHWGIGRALNTASLLTQYVIVSNSYIKEYTKHFPPSEPVEDFEDRVTLYSVYESIY